MPTETTQPNRPLHAAAVVTLCVTFPLIFLGGLVTSHGAGMSVPDWPNSYGYNMFLFPPRLWTGGILFEHTHRLLGTVVGFCALIMAAVAWGPARTPRGRRGIVWTTGLLEVVNAAGTAAMVRFPDFFRLPTAVRSAGAIVPQGGVVAVAIVLVAAVAWRCRRFELRAWVRWLAAAVLAAVCIQGVLGGQRVVRISLPLAIIHGCFAQATFCLMVVTAAVTGQAWGRPDRRPDREGRGGSGFPVAPVARDADGSDVHLPGSVQRPRLPLLAYATVSVVFAQLLGAAVMRHLGAGLAIPDLPLAYGHLLPPTTAAQLAAANHLRVWSLNLSPVTLGQVWLHFAHRCGAVVVSAAVVTLAVVIFRTTTDRRLTNAAVALLGLLATQVTLGLLTVHYRKPADVASAHVACGALVLATTVLIAVRASRLYLLGPSGPVATPATAAAVEPAGELVAV